MKKHLLTLLALLVLPLLGLADSGGIYPNGQGQDVVVTTHLAPTTNTLSVTLTVTAADGSQTTNGPIVVTRDPNGGTHDVLTSPEIPLDGETYRWSNGKFQVKKRPGPGWTTIHKKKTGKKGQGGMERMSAGDVAVVPGVLRSPLGFVQDMQQGDVALFNGYFCPGDETTSLP